MGNKGQRLGHWMEGLAVASSSLSPARYAQGLELVP